MIQSIIDDIKQQFAYGNMLTRIILVNIFVLLVMIIVKAFSPPDTGIYHAFMDYLALSSDGWTVLKRPWTLFTHFVLHVGLWHMGWNMLMLYWFGKIVGDLAGDRRVLPLYILGGLGGALLFLIYAQLASISGSIAFGASGAVMCFVVAAGFLAPDYNMRLLLIGNVRLKYIAATLVILDLIMLADQNSPGSRFGHLGGVLMGGFFVHMLRKGVDLTRPLQFDKSISFSRPKPKSAPMTIVHNKKRPEKPSPKTLRNQDTQERIDDILDKINATGYESLTPEEKNFLYQASKN